MTYFAAYDSFSIYAVADTAANAVAAARTETREPEAEFETAPISDELAAQIEADGWNGNFQSFDVRDGVLVETTAGCDEA